MIMTLFVLQLRLPAINHNYQTATTTYWVENNCVFCNLIRIIDYEIMEDAQLDMFYLSHVVILMEYRNIFNADVHVELSFCF